MPVKTFSLSERPKHPGICIYGVGGSGKTTILETMPGPGILIDIPQLEGGAYVISDQADRIHGVKCEEWSDVDDIYWALAKKDTNELPYIEEIKWVAIDSITAMEQLAKHKVINERDRDLGEDPHKITMQEYGQIGQLTGALIYKFRRLPYTTIFLAQERLHGSEDDPGPKRLGPDVIRSSLSALLPSLSFVGRLGVESYGDNKERRILRLGPSDGEWFVKKRTPKGKPLPRLIRNPNLGEIFRYLYGNGKAPRAAKDAESIL